jgi:hypothetical protein
VLLALRTLLPRQALRALLVVLRAQSVLGHVAAVALAAVLTARLKVTKETENTSLFSLLILVSFWQLCSDLLGIL